MDLRKALITPPHLTIKTPICLYVCAISKKHQIKKEQETINLRHVAVSDGKMVAKLNVYNGSLATKCAPDSSILLRNFKARDDNLTSNTETKIYSCQKVDMSPNLIREGFEMIHPPDAPLCTLQKTTKSPVKTRVTVQGTVTQVL